MAALSVIGLVALPRLNIQYTPVAEGRSIAVNFSYPGASAELVEAEATSRLEGVLSRLDGVTEVNSESRKGSGTVILTFRKGIHMDAARFEAASAVRNIYGSLPEAVSYPVVRLSSGSASESTVSWRLKSRLPATEIEKYAREHIITALSMVKGVSRVSVSGASPYHWVITFDADKARDAGVTAQDIAASFADAYSDKVAGMVRTADGVMTLRLAERSEGFGSIPVKNSSGRIILLSEIATWKYEESEPSSYYRVNGLNTVNVTASVSSESNLIRTASALKSEMSALQEGFPEEITATLNYDSSEYVSQELRRVYLRTGICIAILLLFVLLSYRSWRYLLIVLSTLAVNVLSALAIYAAAGIQIHVYTLAGITVSLGIIIDTTIVMIDHYSRYGNRKVFPSLFAAVATTVAALLLVLLLPEKEKVNLSDFIFVIIINLTLSLAVSYLFVPALMHYLPAGIPTGDSLNMRRLCRLARLRGAYARYIAWGLKHRYLAVILMVVSFGIPLFLIPESVQWKPYSESREVIDKVAGSSFGLFYRALGRSDFYRLPQKKTLRISAGMLEGCTTAQLNDVVKEMENYLSKFDEIAVFTTRVESYDNATITVEFKPEYEGTSFPLELKSKVTAMAINFGGANWRVSGIDDNYFNNNVVSVFKGYHVFMDGYQFDQLMEYAGMAVDYLKKNPRVADPEIWSPGWNGRPATEYLLDYDFRKMTAAGINPYSYYKALASPLFESSLGSVQLDGRYSEVVLRSSDKESFDLWHIVNTPVRLDSLQMSLSSVGDIVKKRSGIDIYRKNQSYRVDVCFDFIGSGELAKKTIKGLEDYMAGILPVGFMVEDNDTGWFESHKERYAWLIFLIIAAIFIILAMAFESFRYPLAVILMIPVSFVGVFLVFGLSDFAFDQGGFAAFVMLSGIVVNAGIYLISAFKSLPGSGVRPYLRAFGRKIRPISLTVLSTVLGLIPFLSDGPEEVFWFDFAAGTIGGMAFSVLALVLLLPLFTLRKKDVPSH